MSNDFLQIEFNNDEIDSVYVDLIRLEVELDTEMAGAFRLRLCMVSGDGQWTNLDESHVSIWKPIVIKAGFEDNFEELLTGYITQIKPDFGSNPEEAMLEIWGMDASVMLDREEKLFAWPDLTDSEIATKIFSEHQLTPSVADTEIVHEEKISTIIQRETDMQFLKRLALRNGYECYVQGSTGFFRPMDLEADPQPVISVHFGEDTNASNFKLTVDGMSPANVAMYQLERNSKEIQEVNISSSDYTPLGESDSANLLGEGMTPGQLFIGRNGAYGLEEMTRLCQGLYHKADWFVQAEVEVHANDYNHVIMPRKAITVRGVGEKFSGIYYVSRVKHVFTPDGYTQFVTLQRNGILPTGDEVFEEGGLLSAVL